MLMRTHLDPQRIEPRVVEARGHGPYLGPKNVDLDERVAAAAAHLAHDLPGLVVQELGHDFEVACSGDLRPWVDDNNNQEVVSSCAETKGNRREHGKKRLERAVPCTYLALAELERPHGHPP